MTPDEFQELLGADVALEVSARTVYNLRQEIVRLEDRIKKLQSENALLHRYLKEHK